MVRLGPFLTGLILYCTHLRSFASDEIPATYIRTYSMYHGICALFESTSLSRIGKKEKYYLAFHLKAFDFVLQRT